MAKSEDGKDVDVYACSEFVTIEKSHYDSLMKDRAKLRALEAGGVDNWEWYSESLESFYEEYEK